MANMLDLVCTATTIMTLLSVPVDAARYGNGGGLRNGFYSRTCPNVNRRRLFTTPCLRLSRRTARLLSSEVAATVLTSNNTVPILLNAFQEEHLKLQGAHTIGKAQCLTFEDRLWTYASPSGVDPTLPSFAATFKKECPQPNLTTSETDLDLRMPTELDTRCPKNIKSSLGLFPSDQCMWHKSPTEGQKQININSDTF